MTRYKSEITLPELYESKVEEKDILIFWHKEKTFQKVRDARSDKDVLSFYSGPVFPTGFPHSGHILNSIVKDVFTRYGHKKNLKVESRFGWDCHGIPLEHEVDKKLDIQSPANIEAMGIANYNEICRGLVDKHAIDWRNVFERTGNWVDFESEYHTMSTDYMEKVWWVFKQLFDKGLVYNATKVMPYSTSCFTHLSNFEAEQNLKEVTETGYTIVVAIIDSSEKLLVWTTNPASLVSNIALCVNPKALYVKAKVHRKRGEEVVYILSKNSLQLVFPQESDYTVVHEFLGAELKDLRYEPLFEDNNPRKEWEVLMQEFVAEDIGSGIVPLDDMIVDSLKQRGLIFNVEAVKYKKPYCWRSNTPLIHKRVNSWHIRVESVVEDLLKNISEIEWCPSNDGGVDFRRWVEEKHKDWTIGRTRYWGTPVPIWSSPSGEEVVCVGSIEELEKLTGKAKITDIHRENVDWMVIPSRTPGNPPLRRVSEVFDCWFESGAVPFALKDQLSEAITVDFVAEGRDQSNSWFYTMLVLSTALSKPAPFRNVVTTGLVLNPDGSKVSKRRHNNNDPIRLIEKYGADAFRLYLLSSPLVAGRDVGIQEAGVAHITECVIQPLWRIFKYCTSTMESKYWVNYGYMSYWENCYLVNVVNGWILSCTESYVKFYCDEMDGYRLENIVPRISALLRQVEDWYIPLQGLVSKHSFTLILFNVIYRICLTMSPFAPFITEYIHQRFKDYIIWYCRVQSIHEARLYPPILNVIDPKRELSVLRMQAIVGLVRALRNRHIIPNQYKISKLVVIHHNENYRNDIDLVGNLITALVNVQEMRVSESHNEFGAALKAAVKSESSLYQNQKIATGVQELKDEDVKKLIQQGNTGLLGQTISISDVQISYKVEGKLESNCAVITEHDLMVVITMHKELFYYEEGAVKDVVNRIKNLKRKGNYYPGDKPTIFYTTKDQCLSHLMSKHSEHLCTLTNSDLKENTCDTKTCGKENTVEEELDVKGNSMKLHLHVKSILE